jgi:flagellar hook protein FlgE
VTYTKTGTTTWSYSVSVPDTLSASPATATTLAGTVTPTSAVSGSNTISTYNFDENSGTPVAATTNLSFGGTAVVVPAGGESITALKNQINALAVAGVSATVSGGVLTVTAPTATATAGSVTQSMAATSIAYNFGSSNGTSATVNTGTNLTITGEALTGGTATITAPTVTTGESLTTYAAALTTALTTAGITGVTVSAAGGTLTVSGANMTTSGSVIQDPVASASATGTLTFDSSGKLVSPATDVSGISFSGLSDGAANLNMTWDLFGAGGTANLSQTNSADGTSATSQNGYATGTNTGFTIDSSGIVAATYSNGQTQNVGQLAIASVGNEQGLVDVGSTEYEATTASGSVSVGTAGTSGRGTIEGSSLEASNVNISAEFSDLIVAQRAFEANSKAVTTFDTITQETINMIH